jgi:signal transduction histidine kinase
LTVWFGLVFLALVAAFTFLTRHTLETELRQKSWQKDYPDHPDWKLHGSFSEAEVTDITDELMESAMLWSVPLVVAALAGGYWLARHSLRPIVNVNRQLQLKNSDNLGEPIQLPEMDEEFRDLIRQLNELLSRLDVSFTEMNNYAAKVAHELRTPLAIIRLKVEQADGHIAPDLGEELSNELHRLSYVVDQSLFIARAERGRVPSQPSIFNLTNTVREVVEDFQLLATDQGRRFTLQALPECWVAADVRHVRQIIHNLLTNALKHGHGDLLVRASRCSGNARLLVLNHTHRKADKDADTLGLGLRVVETLLRLEPSVHYQRRRGQGYYAARLQMPALEPPDHAPV